jgi:hypothetical protein
MQKNNNTTAIINKAESILIENCNGEKNTTTIAAIAINNANTIERLFMTSPYFFRPLICWPTIEIRYLNDQSRLWEWLSRMGNSIGMRGFRGPD